MFTVYRTTNLINGKFYIGVHKTSNPNDSYLGSGSVLVKAIVKYGVSNFTKEVLFTYDTELEAFTKERELVSESKKDPLCYNLSEGGRGGDGVVFRRINSNPTPAMKEAQRRNGSKVFLILNANPTTAMLVCRDKFKRLWENPTPKMKENATRQLSIVNADARMGRIRSRNAILVNNQPVVCSICGRLCGNAASLGKHRISCKKTLLISLS